MRLHPLLMKSIYRLDFKEPTKIQKACFNVAAYQGKVGWPAFVSIKKVYFIDRWLIFGPQDVIGAAETGSGKTLAFGLPILQRLLDEREKVGKLYALKGEEAQKYAADGYLRALIITPTRELALQVSLTIITLLLFFFFPSDMLLCWLVGGSWGSSEIQFQLFPYSRWRSILRMLPRILASRSFLLLVGCFQRSRKDV